jgi:hypothetical protein
LENYLLDLEKANVNLTQQTIFVPPYDSYMHSKQLVQELQLRTDMSVRKTIDQYVATKIKSLQRFYKGMIWLVTSDTLPSEDNSW